MSADTLAKVNSITATDKLNCVKRELVMREHVYRKRIADGTMKRTDAEREYLIMKDIVADYEAVVEILKSSGVSNG